MIPYTVRTGTRRNLNALRKARWRLLVSAAGVWRTEGFRWAADNGAWTCFQRGTPFHEELFFRFIRFIETQARAGNPPDWIVLPDIVMGGKASLDLSMRWLKRLRRRRGLRGIRFMLAVQNGMEAGAMFRRVKRLVSKRLGIFVGGDTDWKLQTMKSWAALAHAHRTICHVGRVNSAKRARLCDIAGVDGFDGSGPGMFEDCLRCVDQAFVQRDLEGYILREAA